MDVPNATPGSPPLPHIHLLCMDTNFSDAFVEAARPTKFANTIEPSTHLYTKRGPSSTKPPFKPGLPETDTISYTVHNIYFSGLPSSVKFDLVVSPANSYGLLDGGFDDAISKAFSPRGEYYALTRYVQRVFWRKWRGYLPVGHAEIIRLPAVWSGFQGEDDWETLDLIGEAPPRRPTQSTVDETTQHHIPAAGTDNGQSTRMQVDSTIADSKQTIPGSWPGTDQTIPSRTKNVWGCRYIAMCPTMRVPAAAMWDREVVYECMWSLLCAIDQHNQRIRESKQTTATTTGATSASSDGRPYETEITSILLTPMGTGCGGITAQRWAEQAVLAIRHFSLARARGSGWEALDWEQVSTIDEEIESTWAGADD